MIGLLVICIVTLSSYTQALIVPQEVPSVLSLVYSTIPQIKKGADSRLGFGFRLGEHADVQFMVELGPQKETQPIGMGASDSLSKRQANPKEFNSVLKSENEVQSESSNWLSNWSKDMTTQKKKLKQKPKASLSTPSPDMKEIQIVPMISESALKQLQRLYALAEINTAAGSSANSEALSGLLDVIAPKKKEEVPKKTKDQITAELMDVDLD